jgi:hypothetical protein
MHRGALPLVATAFLAALAGCSDESGSYLHFTNATAGPVDVILVSAEAGSDYVMADDLQPGATSVTRSDVYPGTPCNNRGVLIARDPTGREVARRTGTICKGDTWTIEAPPSPSPSR